MSAAEALRLKRAYLLPCVHHFYRDPPLIVAADDCELLDSTGRRYFDFFSGVTVVNAGHCNGEIVAAAGAQMGRLDHTTGIYLTEPVLRLAERLSQIAPGGLKRSFFCASGSEANEAALLLAAIHTGRGDFIAFSDSLHGRTKAAMSATGLAMWRCDPALLANFHFAPHGGEPGALDALEALVARVGPRRIAALIAEPVLGNGGIVIPPPDYWPAVRGLCDRHGILLIFDEVQTGMNRTGRWWACEHWNASPDILTTAKALGNGYPVAAVIATDRVGEGFTRPFASTFGGNPVAAAAALATIDFHVRHGLGQRSRERGAQLLQRLRELAAEVGLARPRGLGLMVAADVVGCGGEPDPQRLDGLLEALKDRGFLCGKTGRNRNVLTLMPPLTLSAGQIERFGVALREAHAAARDE